ncbi:MAG: hypothetical protein FJX45_08450 [Alphaproteobacteria bacterium]|nr:hypothetical protein [Alphaproteobacteria bacterium]MBM3652415.1 hypothetical protein [Alphaproteobacteria bacterium]
MQDILESDWTLAAVKRREEERLRSERAAREGDAPTIQASHAPDMSGDHWIAAAFRRRQEEERARAASHPPSGDRADAASREVPVDNWLVEGFKRHQEEERRLEIIARSEEAVADAAGDDHPTSASMRALVVVDEIGKPAQAGNAGGEAGAGGQASSGDFGALVARRGGTALVTRPRGAARLIAIAGVIVVGLVSVFGLKTALWNLGESPRSFDQGPPKANPPPPKTSVAPPPKQTRAPADGGDPPAHPADAAPAKPGDAAPAPPKPQTSTPNPAAPIPQPQPQAPSPSAQQGDKPAQDNRAAPAAPVPAGPKDAASPAKPDTDSTAKPASIGSGAEPDQNASDPQRSAPNANSDSKPKQQAKGKNGARHPSGKSDGLSALLKRTANSVRRFFGRLGVRQ